MIHATRPRAIQTATRSPGRWIAVGAGLAVVAASCGVGHHVHSQSAPTTPPTTRASTSTATGAPCPLTGVPAPGTGPPSRAALAVKIDNAPQARPQVGLDAADIVYEEPVEGGLTRYIVVFQCHDAPAVEPVRSARLVDPDLLSQYGRPLLGYAGGIGPVIAKVRASQIVDVGADRAPDAYRRDPARPSPHNLVTSTAQLWAMAGASDTTPPSPLFTYGAMSTTARPVQWVHVPFSGSSDVVWAWDAQRGVWARGYGFAGGHAQTPDPVTAANVVVQHVVVYPSPYVEDALGDHEWYVTVTGTGTVTVYRNGHAVDGTWQRPSLADTTALVDTLGDPIALAPGPTWIELVPTVVSVQDG